GDPGMIFIDRINKHNPTPHIGQIEATNPCGEQPLLPFESCNLGSVNLSHMISDGKIDFDKLRNTVRWAVRFLDNVIDINQYPASEFEKMTKGNRKIGLGVMGLAEALIKLNIPYNSKEAVQMSERLMRFIQKEARKMSEELGEERGSFPNFKGSLWEKRGYTHMRNSTTTTIAPTGTISIIAGTSSGIEPLFAITFVRNVMEGTRLLEVNHLFEETAKRMGFYSEELMMKIAKKGSVQEFDEVPDEVKRVFVTTFDIAPEWHVRVQAAFQKYTDNAVSKTINFPHDATVEEVKKAYMLAYDLGCKGITVYRYGSKKEQVLYIGEAVGEEVGEARGYVSADPEYAGGCPTPLCIGG
ncbi:MAG: adenosylcobalamin-dependent ribonucleoside-diphosphate reductase, partial [Candidatus Bathyarchaeia archaeon]